jgi:diketogulonate reductase-like aldo/keto reductase
VAVLPGVTSWAQMFLKFAVSHPAVTAVIPATGKPDRQADNLKAWHRRAAQPGAAVRAGQDVRVRVSTLASWHAPPPSFRRNQ